MMGSLKLKSEYDKTTSDEVFKRQSELIDLRLNNSELLYQKNIDLTTYLQKRSRNLDKYYFSGLLLLSALLLSCYQEVQRFKDKCEETDFKED